MGKGLGAKLCLILCVFLAACAKKEKPKPAPVCPGIGPMAADATVVHDRLEIKREQHYFKIKNCQTNQVEDHHSSGEPKNSFLLKGLSLPNESQTGYMATVFNRSTCQFGDYKGHAIKPKAEFMVKSHTSRGTSRMHVLKNQDNYIDYEIQECVQRENGLSGGCVKSKVVERGTVILYIDYSEPVDVSTEVIDNCSKENAR